MLIITPRFHREDGLKFLVNASVTSVLVPLDSVTKSVLQNIETFVVDNVDSHKYKPLWLHDAMYVNLSKWCAYELVNMDGSRQALPEGMVMAKGTYSFEIHVSHVYIGPHKGGETFSLSLHVTRVTYEPEHDFYNLLCDDTSKTPPAPPAPPMAPVKPKLKRGRRRNGLDEIDGPRTVS